MEGDHSEKIRQDILRDIRDSAILCDIKTREAGRQAKTIKAGTSPPINDLVPDDDLFTERESRLKGL